MPDPTLQVGFSDFIVNGKYDMKEVIQPIYDSINEDDDLEISKFVTGWLSGDESVFPGFVDFIENNGITLTELRIQAYREVAKDLELVEDQMAHHQKNVRELLKLIEMRRNNKLARQRLEQEMERLSAKTSSQYPEQPASLAGPA